MNDIFQELILPMGAERQAHAIQETNSAGRKDTKQEGYI
jgi:hypothetical protein